MERKLIASVSNKTEVTQLPAIPVLIDRALKAGRQPAGAQGPAHWVSLDPILALRLLDATVAAPGTGVAPEPRSLEQRFASLQPELAHALLMSAAQASLAPGRHRLSPDESAGFWLHSIQCAHLSRALAEAVSYRNVEEAYLAGLLHDIGTFALLTAVPNTFRSLVAEQGAANGSGFPEHAGRLGTVHAKIGASLIESLALPFYFSDAILLHHAPKAELYGTHPLVRILRAAELLSHPGMSSDQEASVAELLDISPFLVCHLEQEAAKRVNAVLRDLGLPYPRAFPAKSSEADSSPAIVAMARLSDSIVGQFVEEAEQSSAPGPPAVDGAYATAPASSVTDAWSDAMSGASGAAASILGQIVGEATLSKAASLLQAAPSLRDAVADIRPIAAAIAGLKRVVLFVANATDGAWPGWFIDASGAARIDLDLATTVPRSVVAKAAREGIVSASTEDSRSTRVTGLDLQIARLLGSEEIAAVPVPGKEGACRAVLVFGTSHLQARRLTEKLPFLADLAQLIANALARPAQAGAPAAAVDPAEELRTAIRQQVHEIRNPLSVLKTYLQIARDRANSGANLERELEIASQEVDRMAKLLDEVGKPGAWGEAEHAPARRDRTMIERGVAILDESAKYGASGNAEPALTDINRTIRDVLQVYGDALFASKGISVSRMLVPSVPRIVCDASGLKQVLLNLLKNASEAISSEGQVVVGTSDRVNYEGQAMIEISIADNGPGMAPEVFSRLFALPPGAAAGADRGFGLPNSLAIVKSMNGHLLCRSTPGVGTEFLILLPRPAETDPLPVQNN
ncbi:MAG: HDOD domain-containing protein [Pseudomonadota bacterium]